MYSETAALFYLIFIFIFRRVLKNRSPPAGPKIDLNKLPLRISSSNKKESVHSVTGAIGKIFVLVRYYGASMISC
jgi:hypothetical protein